MEVTIMVSLGGLDVPYGANMQLVRTNVLCLDTAPASFTATHAATILSIAQDRFDAMNKPDYVVALETDLSTGYTAATVPTHQVENGVLRDHTAIPVAGNRRDVTASGNRGLAIEAILSVGAMQIAVPADADTQAAGTVDDLFTDAAGTTTGENVGAGETFLSSDLVSSVMKTSFDSQLPAQTFSLAGLLADADFGGGTAIVASDVSGLTAGSKGVVSSTHHALCTAIGDAAWLVSVTSLARVL